MRRITLKRVGPEPVVDYVEVLNEVMRRPLNPQAGADIQEVRQSLRVLNALARANGVLELEDADWEYLKIKTLAMAWNLIDQRVADLVDAVSNG